MNNEVRQAILEACDKRLVTKIDEISAKILDDVSDANYGNLRAITDRVVEKVAQKFFEDNYSALASKIDVERVAKMAEFSAIGKALNR